MQLIRTKNDLSETSREKLVALLNQRLADLTDLVSQSKQAHWNVKGPRFAGLHALFDEIYETLNPMIDDVAERAVQLGGIVHGTARDAAQYSKLREYPHDITGGTPHADALSTALAEFGALVRTSISQAEEYQDDDTADLFTEVSRTVDKYTWMVEAHLQDDR